MAGYEEKVELPPLLFAGLNTRIRDVFTERDFATTARNCDFRPDGSVKKRLGLSQLTVDSVRAEPYDDGVNTEGDHIVALSRQTDGGSQHMLAIRGTIPSQYDFDLNGFQEIKVRFEEESRYHNTPMSFAYDDPYLTSGFYQYHAECMAICCNQNEPHIFTGDDPTMFTESIAVTSTSTNGGIGNPISVTLSGAPAYRAQEGDWVDIQGSTGTLGSLIATRPWRVEWITASSFYLCNTDGSRYIQDVSLSSGTGGTAGFEPHAMHRWPKANWSTATADQRYGYPSRWDDPDGDGLSTWPAGNRTDFPAGIQFIAEGGGGTWRQWSQGVSALDGRMFAYGFRLDPDRVDYSALGIPTHFGKADINASSEANGSDQPGVDGGFFYVGRGDGDKIIGIREFAGYIAVFKQRRTFIYSGIPGSAGTSALGLVRIVNSGAISDNGIFHYGNEIFYWSLDGPRALGPTNAYGDLLHSSLCYEIQDEIENVNKTARPQIHGFWDRQNERVLWFAPTGASTVCDKAFVLYPQRTPEDPKRWSTWDGRYAECAAITVFGQTTDTDEEVYQMNNDGLVLRCNISLADDAVYQNREVIEYNNASGEPPVGETITGGTTAGTIVEVIHSPDTNTGILYYTLVGGPGFANGDAITAAPSGVTFNATKDSEPHYIAVPIELEYISNWRPYGGSVEFAKRALYLTVVFGDGGKGSLAIEQGRDFDGAWVEAKDAVSIRGAEGAYWGGGLWGTMIWNETGKSMVRYSMTGIARLRRFRFFDDSADGVDIVGATMDIHMKGGRG